MHLKMIYKYSCNRTMKKLIVYMVTIILCFIAFALLMFSIFFWYYVNHGRLAVDACLNGGIEQAGTIDIESETFMEKGDAIASFLQEAVELEEVEGIGSAPPRGTPIDGKEELWEKQQQIQKTEDDSYIWVIVANIESAKVCDIKLQAGKMPDEYELDEDVSLLYLGSSYKDIPVGTTYTTWKGEEGEYTSYVAGILEEGMTWISQEVYSEDAIVDATYVENLDDGILAVDKENYSSYLTYTVKKGYSVKEAEKKLRSLAEKHDLGMSFGVVEDILDEKERQHSYIFDTINKMLFAIIITAFILLFCTQFADMLDDTRYFGIFYANGASAKDLICILLGENILKVIVSYLLAVIAVYYAIRHTWSMYRPGVENWEQAKEIFFQQALVPSFLASMVLGIVATLIPILWFKKKSPVELIQGYQV